MSNGINRAFCFKHGLLASKVFPPFHDHVTIFWVKLHDVRLAAQLLGSDGCRASAADWLDDRAAMRAEVLYAFLDQRNREARLVILVVRADVAYLPEVA